MNNLSPDESKYYMRQISMVEFGMEAQLKLKRATVLIVGAGGLGCPVLQYLVGVGVGELIIADGDTVAYHNLHRQILFSVDDIGKNKATVAAEKLKRNNLHVRIETFPYTITKDNIKEFNQRIDVVCDCSDNFKTRYLIDAFCFSQNLPLVSAAIKKYIGQLSVFHHKTRLGYIDIFPDVDQNEMNCGISGVLNTLCGIMGSMQANEVVKVITGIGKTVEGKLLTFDAMNNEIQVYTLQLPANKEAIQLHLPEEWKSDFSDIKTINTLLLEKLKNKHPDLELIDVRENWEIEDTELTGSNIPLHELPNYFSVYAKDKTLVFYCNSGVRSAQAVLLFMTKGYGNTYRLIH